MVATFKSNLGKRIISCYSPTNVSDETDLDTFYNELYSLVRSVPKHNVLIIGGNIYPKIDKNINKFSLHNLSNRNGEHLTVFTLENKLTCLNIKLQKRKGKQWTNTYPNNVQARIDYILMNKNWTNKDLKCEAYSSFEKVSSDHRVVTVLRSHVREYGHVRNRHVMFITIEHIKT